MAFLSLLDKSGHLLFLDLVIIDAESQLDHPVDSVGEESWLVQRESGG